MLNMDLMKQARKTSVQQPSTTAHSSLTMGLCISIITVGLCISTISSISRANTLTMNDLEGEVGKLKVQMMYKDTQNTDLSTALCKSNSKLKLFVDTTEVIGTGTSFYNIPLDKELQEYTYNRCIEYGVDEYYDLILALMWQESNFKADAISKTNDYGLMQINKANHKWISDLLGTTNFLDAYQNINAGTYIISRLLLKYDDADKALMAYNMGEGCAAKHWSRGTYSSEYSRSVVAKRETLKTTLLLTN